MCIRDRYNNYCFAEESLERDPKMFNCDMVLYYLRNYITLGKSPKEMIDPNKMCIRDRSDSEGAQLIIRTLLDSDPRPVHILAWGGANTQANALWQNKQKYSAAEWAKAVSKARLYCIWYQDMYLANLHTSFLCNLIYPTFSRILPVSYTHLDVYKRQPL